MTTLSPTGTRTGKTWTGAVCTASTQGRASAAHPACTAATAASVPTRSRWVPGRQVGGHSIHMVPRPGSDRVLQM